MRQSFLRGTGGKYRNPVSSTRSRGEVPANDRECGEVVMSFPKLLYDTSGGIGCLLPRCRKRLHPTVRFPEGQTPPLAQPIRTHRRRSILLLRKQLPLQDVSEVVQEMIALLRAEASRYSIAIDGDLAHEPPWITADRVQLQQVLMNLMLNGIEAIKGMGAPGKLTVKSQQAENHQVLISVTDTGVGLPPEKVEQIFNALFTTKPGGTGVGLAISRSIIESHGGRLWATSNAGSGATFQFTLPSKVTAHDVA
jgi:light-regulated signal transduction histidine kinase (bacteriophytochrome)